MKFVFSKVEAVRPGILFKTGFLWSYFSMILSKFPEQLFFRTRAWKANAFQKQQ